MKSLLYPSIFALFLVSGSIGCKKSSNNYAATDHTVGLVTDRSWDGDTYGNYYRDTVIATVPGTWPASFNRTLKDTAISITKINSAVISVGGAWLNFKSIDSTSKIVIFDTLYANSVRSFLIYDFGADTMYYEFHRIIEHHAPTGKYYETNLVVRSPHT